MLINERDLKITFNNSEWEYIKRIIERKYMKIALNKPITADLLRFVPDGYTIITSLFMYDWCDYIFYFNELTQRIIAVRKEDTTND